MKDSGFRLPIVRNTMPALPFIGTYRTPLHIFNHTARNLATQGEVSYFYSQFCQVKSIAIHQSLVGFIGIFLGEYRVGV